MHTLFGKRIRARLLPLIMALALTACESSTSQDGPAPSEGSLVVDPISTTFGVGMGVGCDGSDVRFVLYNISAFDAQGRPLGNADIDISIDFAGNTTLVGPVVTLLQDGDTGATVSNPGDPVPYRTETDDIGNKTMFVVYETSAGCTYNGSMTVVSGSLVTTMDFTIEE
jgi:hypothetical protein